MNGLTTTRDQQKAEIRVLIADSTPMGTQLLAESLSRSPRLADVSATTRVEEVLAHMAGNPVEVAVLSADFQGEPGRGFHLAQQIATEHRDTRVVMLLGTADRDSVVRAFRAGCRGVFGRTESVKDLVKCITCVQEGQIWVRTEQLDYVLEAFREGHPLRLPSRDGVPLLTKRETTVVQCVTEGLSNREIAAALNLSEHTIKNNLYRIFDKLGISSRVELILYVANQFQDQTPIPTVAPGPRPVASTGDLRRAAS